MDTFLRLGTTTIEAKSGYGLNLDGELKSLEVLDSTNSNHEIDIISTFMGAHSIPEEYENNSDEYVDYLCNEFLHFCNNFYNWNVNKTDNYIVFEPPDEFCSLYNWVNYNNTAKKMVHISVSRP